MVRMFTSAHAYFMNSTVGEKAKKQKQGESILLNQR